MKLSLFALPIALCLLTTTLSACTSSATRSVKNISHLRTAPAPAMTAQEQSAVADLQWLNNANPVQDAANEISQAQSEGRPPALMAFVQRGLQYPGITPAQLAALQDKVGYKVAEGSGDVIYGETHREMRGKLRAYAIAFNQAIVAALQ